MGANRKLTRGGDNTTPLSNAIDLETMLAPKDYVQIHQALHFTLGFAQKRKGSSAGEGQSASIITQGDCDALEAVIVKVERVLETALRMHKAAQDALVAKPNPKPLIYAGKPKKLYTPSEDAHKEVLKFRSTEHNQGELK